MSEHDESTSASNRREHTRHEWHHRIKLAWVDDASMGRLPIKTTKAENISTNGLAIRTQNMVHPGRFGVVLLGRGEHQTLVRGIEVLHCHYDEVTHNHVVGCRWVPIPEFVRAVADEHKGTVSLSVTVDENRQHWKESAQDAKAAADANAEPKTKIETEMKTAAAAGTQGENEANAAA